MYRLWTGLWLQVYISIQCLFNVCLHVRPSVCLSYCMDHLNLIYKEYSTECYCSKKVIKKFLKFSSGFSNSSMTIFVVLFFSDTKWHYYLSYVPYQSFPTNHSEHIFIWEDEMSCFQMKPSDICAASTSIWNAMDQTDVRFNSDMPPGYAFFVIIPYTTTVRQGIMDLYIWL